MEEIWKPVVGYEGLYEVSNTGKIKAIERALFYRGCYRVHKERVLNQETYAQGYLRVTLSKNNLPKRRSVHRAVAQAFLPNPENKETINHKNGIKTDNSVENLEWATWTENNRHAIATGLNKNKGENGSGAKLKTENVLFIRESKGSLTRYVLAEMFAISVSTIENIWYRKTWKHI